MIDVFTIPQVYACQAMDNKPHAAAHAFRLPDHRILAITGQDALAFAQAQFMNDLTLLTDGQWQWNGWLTAKGRVIVLFALLRLDPQTLWLLLPDADPAPLAEALRRYVFRSKVSFSLPALDVAGRFIAPAQAAGNRFAQPTQTWFELDMSGDAGARTLIIGAAATEDAAARAQWDASDLIHGLPRLPRSQAELWTPQQLSLERLRAFSVKKGCYPGQEIVARTHFLGQAKRGLALLEADAPLAVGSDVLLAGQALGTIVSCVERTALAVLPHERAVGPLQTQDGQPLQERPLAGGLAR